MEEKAGAKGLSGLGQERNAALAWLWGWGSALMRREGPAAPSLCTHEPLQMAHPSPPARLQPERRRHVVELEWFVLPISSLTVSRLHFGGSGCLRPTRAERRCQNLAHLQTHKRQLGGTPRPLPWVLSGRGANAVSGEPF